jgi:RNA polymerase sigma-70 factor, ECF subfamily
MNDDELIARLAGGDDTALRELFSRHAPWLAARLRVILPAADVEDVLQETFLAVWRGASAYQPQAEGSGGGWLWGIARRQAAMWLRRHGRSDAVLLHASAAQSAALGAASGAASGAVSGAASEAASGAEAAPRAAVLRRVDQSWSEPPSPEDAEAAAIARTDLAAAVESLGPPGGPEREVWQLLYVEDRPVAQVAELLGVPEGTVKSRGHRARRLLKAALLGRPAARDECTDNRSVQDRSKQDRAKQDRSAQERPTQQRSAQDRSMQGGPMQGGSVQGGAGSP